MWLNYILFYSFFYVDQYLIEMELKNNSLHRFNLINTYALFMDGGLDGLFPFFFHPFLLSVCYNILTMTILIVYLSVFAQ
jgi:hypothetical protein